MLPPSEIVDEAELLEGPHADVPPDAFAILEGGQSLGAGGFGNVDEHSGAYGYGIDIFTSAPTMCGPSIDASVAYSSRTSARPSTGCVAVKVINHLGGEAVKVFSAG